MESYEHVVKVNALAKELLKHGIVTSSDEAVRRAEATIKSGTPSMQKTASATMEHSPDQEIQKELRQLAYGLADLKKTIASYQEELSKLKDEMGGYRSELNMVRTQVRISKQNVEQPLHVAPQDPQTREEQAQEHLARIIKPKEPEAQKPVEIDKIFYFGKK
ncbi:MAG TPA: hypothetical protein VJB90_06205 [Candidatus Nanoarchaeia archaeon]|nr:hypothetical protein [Candidatus Nanoarchaeia archaeon]